MKSDKIAEGEARDLLETAGKLGIKMEMKVNKRIDHFSFSTLAIPCERALKLKLAGKKQEVLPAEETEGGKRIHKLMPECIEKKDFTPLAEIMEIKGDPVEAWKYFKGKKEYEKKVQYNINGQEMIGFVDVVIIYEGEVILIDHKTSFWTDITPRMREQMKYYVFPFLQEDYKVKTYINFIPWSLILPAGEYEGWEDTAKIKKMIEQDINRAKIISDIEEHDCLAETSRWCAYCPFSLSCPEKATMMPLDPENAKKLAENWLKHNLQAKEEARLLKAWCDQHGEIVIGDQAVGFQEGREYQIDPAIIVWAKEHKLPLDQIINISVQKVKALAKKNPELDNFISIETTSKFGVRKCEKETIPF